MSAASANISAPGPAAIRLEGLRKVYGEGW